MSSNNHSADDVRFDDDGRARLRTRLANLPLRRITAHAPRACVLVSLCTKFGAPAFLFTKRTETVGTHKGQVSFPGGRMDAADADEVACALRELQEETGINPVDVDVLGVFHELFSINGIRVTPVVGFVGEVGDASGLQLAPDEVDVAFALTLDELLAPEKYEWRSLGARRAPFFLAGPAPVWGLTAFILVEFLRDVCGVTVGDVDIDDALLHGPPRAP